MKSRCKVNLILAGGWLLLAVAGRADVRLPAIFSEHMVLQAGKPDAIWGWADPGEAVEIALGAGHASAVAGAEGKWTAQLPVRAAGGPLVLNVQGKNRLTVRDVLVGEVWLCSGQSNMEMQVRGLHGEVIDADREIAAADYPAIRMFAFREVYDIYALRVPPSQPLDDRPGAWVVCSPQTVAKFTALGYFFGRELNRRLGVPVGLVHSSVGGTPIEAWTSLEAQRPVPALQPLLADWERRLEGYDPARESEKARVAKAAWQARRAEAAASGSVPPKAPAGFKNAAVSAPAGLFDGMIAPLIPYSLRGALWYQGERNAAGPFTGLYGRQLHLLIADWRKRWGDDFYFGWVQLPSFQKLQRLPSEDKGWGVAVREGELATLDVPRTGMAVTIDFGGPAPSDGHPKNKADFAARLSRWALHDVYGLEAGEWSGPIYRDLTRRGDALVVSFGHAAGLRPAPAGLRGFAVAGSDRHFVWAQARIEGETVVVSSPAVPAPEAVRYGWAGNPQRGLVNAAGLPASPFRTDAWELPGAVTAAP